MGVHSRLLSYCAYGLTIHSALPLPELVAGEGEADVVIRLGAPDGGPALLTDEERHFWADEKEACLRWEQVGAFIVRSGREIIVRPAPGVEQQTLRLFLLGRVLGMLLHQRGLLLLHASAVAVAHRVVAFLGGKGWGKSTMAAAMYARGYSVVADDLVAVDLDSADRPVVSPGFPQLKLWPDAAARSLGDHPDALPRLHPQSEKRLRGTPSGFPQKVMPIERIYVLGRGRGRLLKTLEPQAAFVELIRHSYATGLLEAAGMASTRSLESTGTTASHFRQCVQLASSVPVCRLTRPRSLHALPGLVKMIERDLNQPAHAQRLG